MTQYRQTTSHLLMVRPAHFGFNEETAASNAFQQSESLLSPAQIQERAIEEFDTFVRKLRAHGIQVTVVQDSDEPVKPDAVFPNNWISFHENGTILTYPMLSALRRLERRQEIIDQIEQHFDIQAIFNLEKYEQEGLFLEGTGSIVLDRGNRIAYACLSPRTDAGLLDKFCTMLSYRKMAFHAVDVGGQDIYHTNVMMAMGETFVVICLDTIRDSEEASRLRRSFLATNKEIIDISLDQMNAFAGNMLQLRNAAGEPFLVMSEQAYKSLRPQQVDRLERHNPLLYSSVDTIEAYGGGSARCMMAEVFLPPK